MNMQALSLNIFIFLHQYKLANRTWILCDWKTWKKYNIELVAGILGICCTFITYVHALECSAWARTGTENDENPHSISRIDLALGAGDFSHPSDP